MKIKDLLENPPQRTGGFKKTVFKTKKNWSIPTDDGELFYHQVMLRDETDEILANVKLGSQRILLQRAQEIYIVVCETKDTDDGRVLEVEEFYIPSATEPPPFFTGDIKIARGKSKCRLIAAGIGNGQIIIAKHGNICKAKVDALVDYIME